MMEAMPCYVVIFISRDLIRTLSQSFDSSRQKSEELDWVRCRDWLALPQVTPYSARTTKISKVLSEQELYDYLKVGPLGLPFISMSKFLYRMEQNCAELWAS